MPGRISSGRLVGRDKQVAELVQAARAVAAEAKPRVVMVGGEAGVGKTRLLTEFAANDGVSGVRLLVGHCVEISQGDLPFAPVVEALRQGLGDLDEDERSEVIGPGRAELAGLLPELREDTGPRQVDASAFLGQGRFFELLLGVLDRLSREPTVLIVEDLHWADASTLDFLRFIARSTRSARLLVVASYRTDELHRRHPLRPFLGEVERLPAVEVLELRRLRRPDVIEQMKEILGETPPFELIERIFEMSDGNPFFVEELLVATDREQRGLPRTIRDVLLFRLEGVSDDAQRILRVASVAGREVSHRLLEDVADLDPDVLNVGLRECVGQHLLVANQERESYAFRHALLREAVYEDLLPGERTQLHRAFASVLDRSSAGSENSSTTAAELAYHYHEARDFPQALVASVAAGDAATCAYAFAEAKRHYERAIDLWPTVPDAEALVNADLITLIKGAAATSTGQGEPDRAVSHIQDALQRPGAEDPQVGALLYERLGRYLWVLGKTGEAHEATQAAVALLESTHPSREHARVLAGQAGILMLSARHDESRGFAERAAAMADEVGARDVLGHALNTLGVCLTFLEDPDAGIENLRQALAIAMEVDEYDDIGRAYTNLCEMLVMAGRFEEALEEYRKALEVDEQVGIARSYGVWHRADFANALLSLGRGDEAQSVLAEVDFLPFGQAAGNLNMARARLAVFRGDLTEASGILSDAASQLEYALEPQALGPLRVLQTEFALFRSDPLKARSIIKQAMEELIDAKQAGYPTSLAWLGIRAEGDISEVARVKRDDKALEESFERAHELHALARSIDLKPWFYGPPTGPFARGALATVDAELGRVLGESSPEAWAEAAEIWRTLSAPYQETYCKWREAEAALSDGDKGRAAAALVVAHGTAVKMGSPPLLEEIRALAVRGRIDLEEPEEELFVPPGIERDVLAGLTDRERQVLALVADGLTNVQIADELFISRKTVSVHVSHILEKFGVSSRVEAAGIAHRAGLAESAGRT